MQCIVILSVHLFTAVLVIDFMNKLVRLVDCVAKKGFILCVNKET